MKNLHITCLTLLIGSLSILTCAAQSPQQFNYQGVARDNGGNVLANQNIGLQFTLHSTSATGPIVYQEIQFTITNGFGLFNVKVGNGAVVSGNISTINWGGNSYYLQVEMDATGGAVYQNMGTSELLSVPYALYAEESGTGTFTALADADSDTRIQVEESTDEDIIRFDMEGTEFFRMDNGRLEVLNTGMSVFIGEGAGASDDLSNNNNVFVGHQAGYSNTTGNNNTASGSISLRSNTTGYSNTASGCFSLFSNTTGFLNTASGYESLFSNTSGLYNTASGYESLFSNTSGLYNTASGYLSLGTNTTGNQNTASGSGSLQSSTTGDYNTASGNESLFSNTTGNYRTGMGNSANSVGMAYDNSTGLGHNADPLASNTVHIGNTSVISIKGQVGFTTYSDKRFKQNVREDEVVGLDFITKLKPVTYNYNIHTYADWIEKNNGEKDEGEWEGKYDIEKIRFSGFLAQDVAQIANEVGYNFSGVDKPKNDKDIYGLRYAEFVVPLVKAVQELNQKLEAKDQEVEELRKQLNALTERMDRR